MNKLKKSVRYELKWKVDDSNGDCTAMVKRMVMYDPAQKPFEESKFQIHVSKNVFRIFPWPGEEVFKQIPENEHDKFSAIARSFYAGINKQNDFYYWEFPEEKNEEERRSMT